MSTTLLEGHVLSVLEGLPAGHFHTCVTSPPYWQLRAYGTPPQVWDAPPEGCEHDWEEHPPVITESRTPEELSRSSTLGPNRDGLGGRNAAHGAKPSEHSVRPSAFCVRCGAWRGELGQEPTPEAFVAHLVAVFEAVRRVLRDDGTLWVNLAGSYWSEPGGQNGGGASQASGLDGGKKKLWELQRISDKARDANRENGRKRREPHPVYKALDWVDVPGLFARAMQAAGWLWRSDVVWVKPSALPESVQGTRWERCRVKVAKGTKADGEHYEGAAYAEAFGGAQSAGRGERSNLSAPYDAEWADCPGCPKCAQTEGLVLRRGSGRPTKATERVLLFAKRPGYFFDQDAVREPHTGPPPEHYGVLRAAARKVDPTGEARPAMEFHQKPREYNPAGRNLRDYWLMGPEPLKDAHYAAFPSALPERCIKAGTSEWGCCPGCGAPYARVLSRGEPEPDPRCWSPKGQRQYDEATGAYIDVSPETGSTLKHTRDSTTLGWRPTCPPSCPGHGQPPVPARCLDPFGGSGTTALAANRLGRDCTLVELKPQYAALARKRVGREPLSLFATHGGEAAPAPPEEPAPAETKQERHPNRTVAGFNQRWNASRRPVGDTGGILPVEARPERSRREAEGAVAGG